MKAMKKTKWGAIALVIALVFASGLTLTGCDNGPGSGPGSGRGFDPVGTWRATYTWWHAHGPWTETWTITLWPGGTGRLVVERFDNHVPHSSWVDNITSFSVANEHIILSMMDVTIAAEILDNNRLRLVWDGTAFNFTRM